MITAIIIVVSCLGYITAGGLVHEKADREKWGETYLDDRPPAFIAGPIWPLLLPWMIGSVISTARRKQIEARGLKQLPGAKVVSE